MDYHVLLTRVGPQTLAVVAAEAPVEDLPRVIPAACGEVWNYIRTPGMPQAGRNVVVYLDKVDQVLHLECGVEVAEPVPGNGRVVGSRTSSGLVATTTHIGDYSRLGEAHGAVHRWCAEQGHALAGPSWEVYGHWGNDPEKVRTDVFWLLVE